METDSEWTETTDGGGAPIVEKRVGDFWLSVQKADDDSGEWDAFVDVLGRFAMDAHADRKRLTVRSSYRHASRADRDHELQPRAKGRCEVSWIQTYTGRKVDVTEGLSAGDLDIEDIAHALSMQCRFGGHCEEFYSVAQHSVHVAEVVSDWMGESEFLLEALLHDAAEAYLLDLPRPIKHSPQLAEYRALDRRVDRAVRARFGLPDTMSAEVKEADEIMLATEAQRLMKHKANGWELFARPIPKLISPWSPREAKAAFLTMFKVASNRRDGAK